MLILHRRMMLEIVLLEREAGKDPSIVVSLHLLSRLVQFKGEF
jgi:hypothetical protein